MQGEGKKKKGSSAPAAEEEGEQQEEEEEKPVKKTSLTAASKRRANKVFLPRNIAFMSFNSFFFSSVFPGRGGSCSSRNRFGRTSEWRKNDHEEEVKEKGSESQLKGNEFQFFPNHE